MITEIFRWGIFHGTERKYSRLRLRSTLYLQEYRQIIHKAFYRNMDKWSIAKGEGV